MPAIGRIMRFCKWGVCVKNPDAENPEGEAMPAGHQHGMEMGQETHRTTGE